MNTVALSAVPTVHSSVAWQSQFLHMLPAVQKHAEIRFRRLRPERREEAIQEAIAAACVNCQLLAARGQLAVAHPGTVADFAVRHVNEGRHVGGSQDPRNDLLSPVSRRHHGFSFEPLDGALGNGMSWWCLASGSRKTTVADLAAFRIDFERWLLMLTRRDQRIIAALATGEQTMAVAERFGLSNGRVSQLRRRYERDWRVFQGEAETMAKAS